MAKQQLNSTLLWRDFPALARTVNDCRLAFLDSAASAQKPACVAEAMTAAMTGAYANIHRGLYHNSAHTTAMFEAARERIAAFLGLRSDGLIFTRNATEGINLVAQSYPFNDGDVVLINALEHHANIVPWQLRQHKMAADSKTLHILAIELTDDHRIARENVALAIEKANQTGRLALVAMTQMSNVTGYKPALEVLIPQLKQAGAAVLVDGSQGAVHIDRAGSGLDCDFYAFTGHKLYGPTGIGGLWMSPDMLNKLPPWQGGGDMIETVSLTATTFANGIARFEAGTPPIIEAIGLAAAVDYLAAIPAENRAQHEHNMAVYLSDALNSIAGLERYSQAGNGIESFNVAGCHPHDVATLLDQQGVAVRSGHHCAMPLMNELNIDGCVRASIGLYTQKDDVDQLVNALAKAKKLLA